MTRWRIMVVLSLSGLGCCGGDGACHGCVAGRGVVVGYAACAGSAGCIVQISGAVIIVNDAVAVIHIAVSPNRIFGHWHIVTRVGACGDNGGVGVDRSVSAHIAAGAQKRAGKRKSKNAEKYFFHSHPPYIQRLLRQDYYLIIAG